MLLAQVPRIKYQLPDQEQTLVDLCDDEDVHLMFDEWTDFQQGQGRTSAKLHIYVDWLNAPSSAGRASDRYGQ